MVTSVCQQCGKLIRKKLAVHWCSDVCRSKRDAAYYPKTWTVVCAGCGKQFEATTSKMQYCSADCPGRKRPEPVRELICVDCGERFTAIGRRRRLRCDTCHKKYRSFLVMQYKKRNNPMTQIGVGSGNVQHWKQCDKDDVQERERKLTLRREAYRRKKEAQGAAGYSRTSYRKIAEALHGLSCCFCGYNQFAEALETHHRDMDRTNNDPSNLYILCSNCHRIIHVRISKELRQYTGDPDAARKFVMAVFDQTKTEVKLRNQAGTNSCSQSEPKAGRDASQGQSVPAGEELLSADTRPQQLDLNI